MTKVFKHIILAATMALVLVMTGCKDDTELINKQETSFESFFSTNSALQYVVVDGVYRSIVRNLIEDDREGERPYVEQDDEVVIGYELLVFNNGTMSLVYTNREEVMYQYQSPLEMDWDFEPLRIKAGTGAILKALDNALVFQESPAVIGREPMCRKGDSVLFLIPSNRAFGATGAGMIPPNTPLAYKIVIEDVIK